MIADELISEIRERVDMLALVGEHVTLRKRGTNHVGLCPFHAEKTPSFNVRAENKYYHCFGCKESGDPFTFMMRIEGLSFPEAVRAVADRVGVAIPEADHTEDATARRERDRRERFYAVMEAATRFYVAELATPHAAPACAELERRGVRADTASAFRLGYAPDRWDALVAHLSDGGFPLDDAEAVGLLARRPRGGHYDRFRHRLLFPIAELAGRVVAFSGRALAGRSDADERDEPKYVNSPESPLYHKGSVLFGLHQGRVALRRAGEALVCEGNFDLLALHQAGFDHAVAPLGTAFTEEHARLLRRFVPRVTLLFDADAAGDKAVRAAFPILQDHGLLARVAALPSGEDPDSFLRGHGEAALRALLERAAPIVEFLIDATADGVADGAAERGAAVASLGAILGKVDNAVERDLYVEKIARRFGISDPATVRRELARGRRVVRERADPSAQTGLAPGATDAKLPPRQTELLGILLEHPTFFASAYARDLGSLLSHPALKGIFETAAATAQENGALDVTELLSRAAGNPALPWLQQRLAVAKYQKADEGEEVLRKGLSLLAKENIERELPRLAHEIAKARRGGEAARADDLTREREELARTAHRLVR